MVKRLSGDYSCEAFLEGSYEKVLRCSSTYGGQYMNDHEIFVASFDYHYALRKLNELGDKDTSWTSRPSIVKQAKRFLTCAFRLANKTSSTAWALHSLT